MNKLRQMPRRLKILCIVIVVIVVGGVLGKNYLLPWQIPLFNTRQVLIKYMKSTHPNYHIAEREVMYHYAGGTIFPKLGTGKPSAEFVCDEEGFRYFVSAYDGRVTTDTYSRHKLSYGIEEFARKGFLEPHGIENVGFYCSFDLDNDKLPSNWYRYSGEFDVTIYVRGQGTTPQEVGWLWDFYEFWRDNQQFSSDWSLNFEIYYDTDPYTHYDSSISIWHSLKYGSKEEWYADKTYIPNPRPIH